MGSLTLIIVAGFWVSSFSSDWLFPLAEAKVLEDSGNDEDDYTRGQIHYLSMDAGMSSCWNHTVKKLFHLACPQVATNPDLTVELAFILTSCFCISIGAPHLTCRYGSPRDDEEYHHLSLIDCAIGKCFNTYGLDGFEINYERMPDICYYIVEKSKTDPQEMALQIGDSELHTLIKIVSGEYFGQFDTKLKMLQGIVTEEFQNRQQGIMFWLRERIRDLWLVMDDLKFKLRIGNYADVPYY